VPPKDSGDRAHRAPQRLRLVRGTCAFDPASNCDPRFCVQMLWLLFALHASVTQSAQLHRRTKAAGPYAPTMTMV